MECYNLYSSTTMPREFYEVPESAPALFSTLRGTIPKRRLQEPPPLRIARSSIDADLALQIHYYWTTFPDLICHVKTPQNWCDLYHYFDAVDLWTHGPDFLFYLLNTISNYNQQREFENFHECEQEIKTWAAEWVAANRELLLTVPLNHNLLEFFSQEELEDLQGLTSAQYASLTIALRNEHLELIRHSGSLSNFLHQPQPVPEVQQAHVQRVSFPSNIQPPSDLRRYSVQVPKKEPLQYASQNQNNSRTESIFQWNDDMKKNNHRGHVPPQDARAYFPEPKPAIIQSQSRNHSVQRRHSSAPQASPSNGALQFVGNITREPIYTYNAQQISPPRRTTPHTSPSYKHNPMNGTQWSNCGPRQFRDRSNSALYYRRSPYSDEEAFQRILDNFKESERQGHTVTYFYREPRLPDSTEKLRTAYVGGVEEVAFTSHEIKNLMSNCGTVEKVKYLLPYGGTPGSAFVTFKENDAVSHAITRYDFYKMISGEKRYIRVDFVRQRRRSESYNPDSRTNSPTSKGKEKFSIPKHRPGSKPPFSLQQIDEHKFPRKTAQSSRSPISTNEETEIPPSYALEVVEKTPATPQLPRVGPMQINTSLLTSTLSDVLRYKSAFDRLDSQRLQEEHCRNAHEITNTKSAVSHSNSFRSSFSKRSFGENQGPLHDPASESFSSSFVGSRSRNKGSKKYKNNNSRKPLSDIFPDEFCSADRHPSGSNGDNTKEGPKKKGVPSPQSGLRNQQKSEAQLPARAPTPNSTAIIPASKQQTGESDLIKGSIVKIQRQNTNSNNRNPGNGTVDKNTVGCSEVGLPLLVDDCVVDTKSFKDETQISSLQIIQVEPQKQKQKNKRKQKQQSSGDHAVQEVATALHQNPGNSNKKIASREALPQKEHLSQSQYDNNINVMDKKENIPMTQRTMSETSFSTSHALKAELKHQQTKSLPDFSPSPAKKGTGGEFNGTNTGGKCPNEIVSEDKPENLKANLKGKLSRGRMSKEKHRNPNEINVSAPTSGDPNNGSTIPAPGRDPSPQPLKHNSGNDNQAHHMDLAFADESQWPALQSTKAADKGATNRKRVANSSGTKYSGSPNIRTKQKIK